MLLSKWAMPESVVQAVRHHIDPTVGGKDRTFAMDALYVAIQLSRMVISKQQIDERRERQQVLKEERPTLGGQLLMVEEYEQGETIQEVDMQELPENVVARFGMGIDSLYASLYGLQDELMANQMFLDL